MLSKAAARDVTYLKTDEIEETCRREITKLGVPNRLILEETEEHSFSRDISKMARERKF